MKKSMLISLVFMLTQFSAHLSHCQEESPAFPLRDAGITSIWTGQNPSNEEKEVVRVIQGYMNWDQIEKERGIYDWAVLKNVLDRAESLNKPLVLQINARIPEWMKNHVPYMGFKTRGPGYPAYQFYHPQYIAIYKDLIEAFASKLDTDPRKHLVAGVRIQNNAFNTEAWNWEYNNDEVWKAGTNALGGDPDDPSNWPEQEAGVEVHYPLMERNDKSAGIEYMKEIISAYKSSFHSRDIRTFARFELIGEMSDWLEANYWHEPMAGALITNFRLWWEGNSKLYELKKLANQGLVTYMEDTKGTDVGYRAEPPSRNMDIYWRQILKLYTRVTYAATYGPDLSMTGNKAWDESFEMVNRFAGLHNKPESATGAFIVFCFFKGLGNNLYDVENTGYFLSQSNHSTKNLFEYGDLNHPYGYRVRELTGSNLNIGMNPEFASHIKDSTVQLRVTYYDRENAGWNLKVHNGEELVTLSKCHSVEEGSNWKTDIFYLINAAFPGNLINDLVLEKTGENNPVFHKVEVLLGDKAGDCTDFKAPTAPSGLEALDVDQNSLELRWYSSYDEVGIVAYDVYINADIYSTLPDTSLSVTALHCDSSYSFEIRAKDAAGNISYSGNSITVTTSECDANSSENMTKPDNISVYPVPFQEEFHIRFNGIKGKCTVKIYNIAGSCVLSDQIIATGNNLLKAGKKLNCGIYIVKFEFSNRIYTQRIVKEQISEKKVIRTQLLASIPAFSRC